MQNFAYLIGDEKAGVAAIVDPAWDAEKTLEAAQRHGVRVVFIINTHGHPDHASGNNELAKRTGAKTVAHESSRTRRDISVRDGEALQLGSIQLKFIHTPGHSPDGVCVLADGKLMTGDTLFVGECGRTDLPGGNPHQLHDSLFKKLMRLPDDIEVYPGHDYGAQPHSTIGHERAHNYVLKPRTVEEFVKFMKEP